MRQHQGPLEIGEVKQCMTDPDEFVWLGMHEPSEEELRAAQGAFGLHELAVEDALRAHQRPKIEDYENAFFVVLKTARYDDAAEEVHFGEIHLFLGAKYVIAVRHGAASELGPARRRLEDRPELLKLGPAAVVWAILDKVVDDYQPVVDGIENDIEEVEVALFEQGSDSAQRIYFLKREVIEFHRAVAPLLGPLQGLEHGAFVEMGDELHRYFRDVADHARRVEERVASQRELLTSVLEANLALLSVRQNEVVRQISAWAAIIAVPTFIASVYGMNFEHMPELHWSLGYPLALSAMVVMVAVLYRYFKRIAWL